MAVVQVVEIRAAAGLAEQRLQSSGRPADPPDLTPLPEAVASERRPPPDVRYAKQAAALSGPHFDPQRYTCK